MVSYIGRAWLKITHDIIQYNLSSEHISISQRECPYMTGTPPPPIFISSSWTLGIQNTILIKYPLNIGNTEHHSDKISPEHWEYRTPFWWISSDQCPITGVSFQTGVTVYNIVIYVKRFLPTILHTYTAFTWRAQLSNRTTRSNCWCSKVALFPWTKYLSSSTNARRATLFFKALRTAGNI